MIAEYQPFVLVFIANSVWAVFTEKFGLFKIEQFKLLFGYVVKLFPIQG